MTLWAGMVCRWLCISVAAITLLDFLTSLVEAVTATCINLFERKQSVNTRQEHKKNPRPKTALPMTNLLEAKDSNALGQGQGPRAQALVFSKQNKKKVFKTYSQAVYKILHFKKYCCPRVEDWAIFEELRPRSSKYVLEASHGMEWNWRRFFHIPNWQFPSISF